MKLFLTWTGCICWRDWLNSRTFLNLINVHISVYLDKDGYSTKTSHSPGYKSPSRATDVFRAMLSLVLWLWANCSLHRKTSSTLQVSHFMRYINSRLSYILITDYIVRCVRLPRLCRCSCCLPTGDGQAELSDWLCFPAVRERLHACLLLVVWFTPQTQLLNQCVLQSDTVMRKTVNPW